MKAKYVVIPALGLLFGGLYYKTKIDNVNRLSAKIKALPTGLRNPRFEKSVFKCNIDVTLFNPTNETFNADGILSFLKRVNILLKGKKIASVNINKSKLNIPAHGQFVLKDLEFEVSLLDSLLNVNNISQIKSSSDISIESVVSILGKEQIIK